MTTRSTQLGIDVGVGTTEVTLYTVPTGKRSIVKGLQMTNTNAAANFTAIEVYSGATLLGFWREYMAAGGVTGDSITKELWLVLNAGQALKAVSHAASVSVIVSGAELPSP